MKNTPVERVMTRKVVTATLTDTLEDAIVLLYDFRMNALPVVDAAGTRSSGSSRGPTCWRRSSTSSAWARSAPASTSSSPTGPGRSRRWSAIIGSFHVNITSVLTTGHVEAGKRANFFRVATLNVGPIRKAIEEAGFEILDPSKFLLP